MTQKPSERSQAPARGQNRGADALTPSGEVDPEKLKQNQQRLNVDEEHKTPEMKKGGRGTFP